jgi:hypothetical protein
MRMADKMAVAFFEVVGRHANRVWRGTRS